MTIATEIKHFISLTGQIVLIFESRYNIEYFFNIKCIFRVVQFKDAAASEKLLEAAKSMGEAATRAIGKRVLKYQATNVKLIAK